MSGKNEKLRRKMIRQKLNEEWNNTLDLKNYVNSCSFKERLHLAINILRRRF